MKTLLNIALLMLAVPLAISASAQTAPDRDITLGWTAPTQNEDGTPVDDLARFNLYARPDTNFVAGQDIVLSVLDGVSAAPASNEQYTADWAVSAASTGIWFTVTAVDFSGNESDFCDPLFVVDDTPPGEPSNLRRVIETLVTSLETSYELARLALDMEAAGQ